MREEIAHYRLILLALLLFAASNAQATIHALLVGVGDYPQLEAKYRLKGPVNDVEALSDAFQNKGIPANRIQTLTNRQATRANIVDRIQKMTVDAQSGDMVVLYFSGHGSQSPVKQGRGRYNEETDYLNEFFLPADIGRWDGTRGAVNNALLDDDFDDLITAIRRKGVFVWAIYDTCHAATSTRAGDEESIARSIPSEALGIPVELMPEATRSARDSVTTLNHSQPGPGASGLVAYYAADEAGKAQERLLPSKNGEPRYYGVFTHALIQALQANAQLPDYKTLFESIAELTAKFPDQPPPQIEGTVYQTQAVLIPPPAPIPPTQIKPELRLALGSEATLAAQQALNDLLGLQQQMGNGFTLKRVAPDKADALVRSCPNGKLYLAQAKAEDICAAPDRMALDLSKPKVKQEDLREDLCRMAAGAHLSRLPESRPADSNAKRIQIRFDLQKAGKQNLTHLTQGEVPHLSDGDIIRPSIQKQPGQIVDYALFFIDSLGRAWLFDSSLKTVPQRPDQGVLALKGIGISTRQAGTIGKEKAVLMLRDAKKKLTKASWSELTICGVDRLEYMYPENGYVFRNDWQTLP